jgi:N-formylglutamate amidohydrolase
VTRNRPYAGGHITARYGRPEARTHAVQIEICRGLFMDEATGRPHASIADLRALLRRLLSDLIDFARDHLVPGTLRPALTAL